MPSNGNMASSLPPTTGDAKSTTSTTSKTLSKRWVYLPMIAYDACNATKEGGPSDPQAYMASRKHLPNSVQEKSLVEFWYKIGVDYHRNRATVHDPKNNGNKPIALAELDDRIRQRAMMLVGGGINTDWAGATTTTTTTSSSTGDATNPKLQKVRRDRKTRKRQLVKSTMNFSTNDEDGRIGRFLFNLNTMWNDYIVRLLQLPQAVENISEYQALCRDVTVWSRITACITNETVQLVGARVQIKSCHPHPQWKGRTGILVRKTPNTWQLMVSRPIAKSNRKKRKANTEAFGKKAGDGATNSNNKATLDEKSGSTGPSREGLKTLVVPKRGSELTLLIPIVVEASKTTKSKSDDAEDDPFILTIDIREDV